MLKIRLLGRCTLETEAPIAIPAELSSAKARELLGYLSCHPDRDLGREELIATLWGDIQQEQGKKALRQTLWQIQSTLTPLQTLTKRPFIEAQRDWVRLNSDPEIWCDVIRFEHLYQDCLTIAPRRMSALPTLQEVSTLYRGHLLQNCFQDWCIRERERLREMYLTLLTQMMEQEFESGDPEVAQRAAQLILREEPASENAHWVLMSLYHRSGDRTAALRQYQQCQQALRRDLDIGPSQRLNQLRDQIRRNSFVSLNEDPSPPSEMGLIPDTVTILRQIQDQIHEVSREIQRLKAKLPPAPHSSGGESPLG